MKKLSITTQRVSSQNRAVWLGLGMVSFFLLLVVRLAHVQLVKGSYYADQAQDNRLFSLPLAQNRGIIFDRYHQPLVLNSPEYYLVSDAQALFSDSIYVSREEAIKEMIEGDQLVAHTFSRTYLFPDTLSHVLGYIAPASTDEIISKSVSPSDLVGRLGLEASFDSQLRGSEGTQIVEIDALGSKKRLVEQYPATDGQSVVTTLDPVLSEVASAAMGDSIGAVVIMDPATGQVYSLLSQPNFNAQLFTRVLHDDELEKNRRLIVQDLLTDERKVLFNRAVSGAYPPGSVFKIVTALAGLDTDAYDENTTVLDEGILEVGEYSYANWFYTARGGVDGEIAVQRAIARSNDIFFYKAAEWTGPNKIAEMARLFGYGKPTGIEMGSETSGLVPDPAWKEENLGERWFLGNTYHFGIGQGDTLVSPLQVAQMTQIVSQHGTLCPPTLVDSEISDCQVVGVADEDMDIVLNGMLDACSAGGTAGVFFARNERYRDLEESSDRSSYTSQPQRQVDAGSIACKTGTAEFGGQDEEGFRNTHAWFTSVAGLDLSEWEDRGATDSAELVEAPSGADVWTKNQHRQQIQELLNSPEVDYQALHTVWRQMVAEHPLPKRLVFTVLVESDDKENHREGSVDAAPVVKSIIDWIETGQLELRD